MAVWHTDPAMAGRFHPDHPDDVQVLLHEGSFRFTPARPEVMWARLIGRATIAGQGGRRMGAYRMELLSQPLELQTLAAHDHILAVCNSSYPYVIRVSETYLTERTDYEVWPCNQCGLPELFDNISALTAYAMGGSVAVAEQRVMMFTSACPLCGGTLVVRHKDIDR